MWCSPSKGWAFVDMDEIIQKIIKKTLRIFDPFQSFIWMPWSILINEVSFLSWEKALIHQIHKKTLQNWLQLQSLPLMCCITYVKLNKVHMQHRGGSRYGLIRPPLPFLTAKSCKFSLFWGYISYINSLPPPNFDTRPPLFENPVSALQQVQCLHLCTRVSVELPFRTGKEKTHNSHLFSYNQSTEA